MNVSILQEHVTHLSVQLSDATQDQEVTIGGKIVSIVPPLSRDFPMYVLTLDDFIGTLSVYVSPTLVETYPESFKAGEVVVLEGLVNVVTRTIKKEVKREISVFAYFMKDVSLKVGEGN